MLKCPRCSGLDVFESRLRYAWERLGEKILRRRPYRCGGCRLRFFRKPEMSGRRFYINSLRNAAIFACFIVVPFFDIGLGGVSSLLAEKPAPRTLASRIHYVKACAATPLKQPEAADRSHCDRPPGKSAP